MNYIFFGTPDFAAIILEKLIKNGLAPTAVVCNPDRPSGRDRILTPPAVKLVSQKYNIPVFQPEKVEKDMVKDYDFAVLAAYGKILPSEVITAPRKGFLGVHPSLLPKYRGATPIQSVILNGEEKTGVTLFVLDEKVDHGPIIAEEEMPVSQTDTTVVLQKNLAELAGDMLTKVLPKWVQDEINPQKQDESKATYTKKIVTDDGFVDLKNDAPAMIYGKIKALNPDPGVFTYIEKDGKKIRMKILDAEFTDGKLKIKTVQLEGGRPKEYLDL